MNDLAKEISNALEKIANPLRVSAGRLIDLSYPHVTAARYGITVRSAKRLREHHPYGLPEDALLIFVAEIKRNMRTVPREKTKRAISMTSLGMYSQVPGMIRKK